MAETMSTKYDGRSQSQICQQFRLPLTPTLPPPRMPAGGSTHGSRYIGSHSRAPHTHRSIFVIFLRCRHRQHTHSQFSVTIINKSLSSLGRLDS